MSGQVRRLLIANRGEIACRIMRTARKMGVRTVAVYSDPDAGAPHVSLADQAIRIGPGPAAHSYLNVEALLAAAAETGADAVHPGYGFLSENAAFATACAQAGLTFVGPPASAIEAMGNKARAKRAMIAAGVPCVPGHEGAEQSVKALLREGRRIGFPVMVKAAAGGGGRGMRLVGREDDLAAAIALARAEAESAFGSGELILEKAIVAPRHVEVQVFADAHGAVLHLGERDCSVQRRHQKVLEEAPCPVMTPALRAEMGAAAVKAACVVGYRGAGTVEFLLDQSGAFYFLEMNTRLQVEHPVTEMVTGLDLVELQIRVARGEKLPFRQEDLQLNGHAIEARIYAEDPARDFVPSLGRIALWAPPDGPGVRVDAGVETGQEISAHYDAMVAKVIAWGETREQALRRLDAALGDTALCGPTHNVPFLKACLAHPTFRAGAATTGFIGAAFGGAGFAPPQAGPREAAVAAVALFQAEMQKALSRALGVVPDLLGWSSAGAIAKRYDLCADGRDFRARVSWTGDAACLVDIDTADVLTVQAARRPAGSSERAIFFVGGEALLATVTPWTKGEVWVAREGVSHRFTDAARLEAATEVSEGAVLAPMPGLIVAVHCAEGDVVAAGAALATMEAMKMQHQLLAPRDGVVAVAPPAVGRQLAAGELVFRIEGSAAGAAEPT